MTAIDLPRLAKLVGCSVSDLTGSLVGDESVLHASGRVAESSESVAFEPCLAEMAAATVDTAVLSVASRPSVLDTAQSPKVLMNLAGQPVIGHVLSQLYAAGVRRAILVLGSRGRLIKDVVLAQVSRSPLLSRHRSMRVPHATERTGSPSSVPHATERR